MGKQDGFSPLFFNCYLFSFIYLAGQGNSTQGLLVMARRIFSCDV